jgi:hypothetical protein
MIILPIVHLKYSFDDQDFQYIVLTSRHLCDEIEIKKIENYMSTN